MKASDIKKVEVLISSAKYAATVIKSINDGEPLSLTIGKNEVELGDAYVAQLRVDVLNGATAYYNSLVDGLKELGVEL